MKDTQLERYLTIWIGVCEADAITWELQEHISPRPLTHDLIKNAIRDMGGTISSIVISDLKEDIFYARTMVELACGASILWLPAYSPDFSPIEHAFSKLKTWLRRVKAMTQPALVQAIKDGLAMITASDALSWFIHCGYLNIA